jgi:phage/plasmid-like protein (TIGR03299 family)
MAHALSMQKGKVEMMYVGPVPWHELGKQLNRPATANEAIKAAGLDWEVFKAPIFLKRRRRYGQLADKFAVLRADHEVQRTPAALGIVGKQYKLLQNREAFAWFDGIVGQGAAIYHTAGALGNGERIWILAKLPGAIHIVGDDIADKYLLLSNSHDGQSGVQVKFTPIRVVCQNTLTMALNTGKTLVVKHTQSLHEQLVLAKENLGIIDTCYSRIGERFREMAAVQVNQERLRMFHELVFPEPTGKNKEKSIKRAREARAAAAVLFEDGFGNAMPQVKGTLWAAYNGVAQYVDYRLRNGSPDQRLDSIWFGDGYLTKARAFKVAVAKLVDWKN